MSAKRKTVRIDVKPPLVEMKNYEQINKPDRSVDNLPSWLNAMDEPPTETLPKDRNKKQTIAQRVRALAKQSNGKRPLMMATHVPERRRRHRHAEATEIDRLHNASYDGGADNPCCDYSLKCSCWTRAEYAWEESDRMFDKAWHGESE
tara:strand:- start:2030 stop:2473 length:444 start_codon:yes stop_codon:yes gene_type:complete